MVAFNVTALIIPAIIGAIVIALALLIDDYVNWKEGNDSVIGGLVQQFPQLLTIIQGIEKAVGTLVDFWIEQWSIIGPPVIELSKALWNLVTVLVGALWPVVKMIFTGWAYIMAAVIPMVASLLALIIEGWVNLASWLTAGATTLVDVLSAIVEGIAAVFDMTFANVGDLWGALTDLLTGNFQGVADHLIAIWDRVISFWMGGFEKIKGAAQWVAEKLGFTSPDVKVAAAAAPAVQSSAETPSQTAQQGGETAPQAISAGPMTDSLAQPGGVVGNAANTSNAVTNNSTSITGTTINVTSPDADKAGKAVKQELDRMNKQTTRNGQSAVAL